MAQYTYSGKVFWGDVYLQPGQTMHRCIVFGVIHCDHSTHITCCEHFSPATHQIGWN